MDKWVGVPALNTMATFRRRRRAPSSASRIGVMCSPALGDTLLFSGALQDLRAALPAAHITHVCMPQNSAAAEILPGADERLPIDLARPWKAIPALRRHRFDVFLDFTSWQRLTAFCTLSAGARFTAGFQTRGERRSRGFDRAVEHRDDLHETANFRRLLENCGLPLVLNRAHVPAIDVPLPPTLPYADEPDLVALHLWASGQRSFLREWPESRWLKLAQALAGPETLFLLTGAPADVVRMRTFAARMHAAGLRAEPFVSPDGFVTLTHLLRRSRLVVSVNTGVMHLAAIAGARTVSINGPNRNGRWGPVGPRAVGVEAPGGDCGFLHLGFNFDGNPTDCMERISVDAVLAACQALEKATPDTGPEFVSGFPAAQGGVGEIAQPMLQEAL